MKNVQGPIWELLKPHNRNNQLQAAILNEIKHEARPQFTFFLTVIPLYLQEARIEDEKNQPRSICTKIHKQDPFSAEARKVIACTSK